MDDKSILKNHAPTFLAALIALMTLVGYLPALRNDFVNWDDGAYIVDNIHIRSLDGQLLRWSFTEFHSSNWHPLTWLSHALDYAFWGLNPAGHHLTSIIIHSVNTFLVVLLALSLLRAYAERAPTSLFNDRDSMLVAAGVTGILFGLHPLHVESVAWVSERKDLLCGLFFLLSIREYVRYAGALSGTDGQGRRPWPFVQRHYAASFALFLLALLSKPMAVTLPVVLLILDWHPFRRVRSLPSLRTAVLEKRPFFVLSLGSSVMTLLAQRTGGAIVPLEVYPLPDRLLVGLQSLLGYLGKMVFPGMLHPYDAFPATASLLSLEYLVPVLLIAAMTVGCIVAAGKRPIWAAVWSCYVVTLLPVLGIVQVGNQSMADRYTYLPSLVIFLLVGIGAALVWAKAGAPDGGWTTKRGLAIVICVLVVAGMFSATSHQIAVWKDGLSLWSFVIDKNPRAGAIPYNNRGELYYQRGQYDRALEDLDKAIELSPSDAAFRNNRGLAYERTGRLVEAVVDYDTAVSLAPSYVAAYYNRAILLMTMNNIDLAVKDFDRAIALDPQDARFYNNRGIAFDSTGRTDRGIADFTRAIELDPDHINSFLNRGRAYRRAGDSLRARADYQKACDRGSADGCEALRSLERR